MQATGSILDVQRSMSKMAIYQQLRAGFQLPTLQTNQSEQDIFTLNGEMRPVRLSRQSCR